MKYLRISNKGILDIKLVALMGGTTKGNDTYKLGQFGTGMKYTFAYLLRNNIEFNLFIEDKEIKIHTKYERISDMDFNIIYINNEKTSITTNMGLDWEAWMIIRELWSNALDEGTASYSLVDQKDTIGKSGFTSFYIGLTPEILEVYNNWNKYFISKSVEPIYESDVVRIFPAKGPLQLYKQGILIHELKQESLFNYDIKHTPINELREFKGSVEYELIKVLMNITDTDTIRYFLENVTENHYEGKDIDFDYGWYSQKFNSAWEETLKGVKVIHKKAAEKLKNRGIKIDEAANIIVPEKLYKGLTKSFDGIGALRVSKAVNDFFEIYNEKLHDKVMKAKGILEKTGYYIEPELTFTYGIFGDKKVLAKVDLDTKKVYISEKHIDTDIFSICTMLIEENEHFKTGFTDESRAFQQHFINLYANSILEKASVDLLN